MEAKQQALHWMKNLLVEDARIVAFTNTFSKTHIKKWIMLDGLRYDSHSWQKLQNFQRTIYMYTRSRNYIPQKRLKLNKLCSTNNG